MGEMSTALAKVHPRAGDLAGAVLADFYVRLAGVDYEHGLLSLDQRRGVDVQEDVKPLVLGLVRGLVLSLGFTFFKSEVLPMVLQKMSPVSSLRVEGPVSQDKIQQYTVIHTEAGGGKTHRSHTSAHCTALHTADLPRCPRCPAHRSKNFYDVTVHILVCHFQWHKLCVLPGCGEMGKVNLSGQADHTAQHGKNNKAKGGDL